MDTDAAFALIQRSLEEFGAEIGKARAEQVTSEEVLASVEYEFELLKKLVAENALPA
jgi:ribosomal protein S24E